MPSQRSTSKRSRLATIGAHDRIHVWFMTLNPVSLKRLRKRHKSASASSGVHTPASHRFTCRFTFPSVKYDGRPCVTPRSLLTTCRALIDPKLGGATVSLHLIQRSQTVAQLQHHPTVGCQSRSSKRTPGRLSTSLRPSQSLCLLPLRLSKHLFRIPSRLERRAHVLALPGVFLRMTMRSSLRRCPRDSLEVTYSSSTPVSWVPLGAARLL